MKKIILLLMVVLLVGGVSGAWDNLDENLVMYMTANDSQTSGTTAIDITNQHNGTMGASITTGDTGILGECYNWTGLSTSYINYSTNSDFNPEDMSISFWFYLKTDGSNDFIEDGVDGDNFDYKIRYGTASKHLIFYMGSGSNDVRTSANSIVTGQWYHIVVVYDHNGVGNMDKAKIYINGTDMTDTSTGTIPATMPDNSYLFALRGYNQYLDGAIDELAFFNKSLSQSEVDSLWNNHTPIPYPGVGVEVGITVTLNSPTNNSITGNDSILLNATTTPGSANLTNATLFIWYANGTLFNTTTNSLSGDVAVNTTFNVSGFIPNTYIWNVLGKQGNGEGINSSYATSNFTFEWVPFTVNNESYINETYETVRQTFTINITTASDYTVNNGRLVYNGTTYENAEKTDLGGGSFLLSQEINIPIGSDGFGSENRSFRWNITLIDINVGTTFNSFSEYHNQTVNELIITLCSSPTANDSVLNFTMIDEDLGTEINATANPTTFQATFEYGLDYNYLAKTYSINNISVATHEFDFCINNASLNPYVDMELFYEATGYSGKNYFLTNASLNGSATEEIDLYLINESTAIEFFIYVEEDLTPITSAIVNIKKYFVGEGVYKTVEIDKTSSDSGEFTAYLDLDKDYSFTISKDGEVLGTITKTASCKQAPCELTLGLRSSLYDVYHQFSENFAGNVVYTLEWNPNTKIVTFDFTDTTGLADYFRMEIFKSAYNETTDAIFDSTLYTSAGTITANLSNYTDGTFTAKVYVSRSPEIIIDFIKFIISEFVDVFGLLGLFVAFLLVMTIIFGLAFSPPILCLSIPLALTMGQVIGILSLSATAIIITYILAGIAVGVMTR